MVGFAAMVERAGAGFLATARATVEITVEKLEELTIEESPVGVPELWKRQPPADYKPGSFKSNWRLSVDRIDSAYDRNRTSSFFVARVGQMPASPFGHRFVFSNAHPAAWRIEMDKWAKMKPEGVVGPVSLEFGRLVREAATEARSRTGGVREL